VVALHKAAGSSPLAREGERARRLWGGVILRQQDYSAAPREPEGRNLIGGQGGPSFFTCCSAPHTHGAFDKNLGAIGAKTYRSPKGDPMLGLLWSFAVKGPRDPPQTRNQHGDALAGQHWLCWRFNKMQLGREREPLTTQVATREFCVAAYVISRQMQTRCDVQLPPAVDAETIACL
jgi:hypothetical protein